MVRRVILVSGPPGAGKSTVCRELVSHPASWGGTPGRVAYVEGDTFWAHLPGGTGTLDAPLPPPTRFRAVMTAMAAAALSYALFDVDVVLDFSVPPWFLDKVRDMAAKRGVPLAFVVLLPPKAACAARVSARAKGAVADYDAHFGSLYADFASPDPLVPQHVVPLDSAISASDVAAALAERLARGEFVVS